MPTFHGGLQAIRSQSSSYNKTVGKLYRYFVADPTAIKGVADYEAFYYPEDRLTILGTGLAALLNYNVMKSGNVVPFELRSQNPAHHDQIRVVVDYDDIRINPNVPDFFLKIGAQAASSVVTVTNWKQPWMYASAPPMLELTCNEYLNNAPNTLCY